MNNNLKNRNRTFIDAFYNAKYLLGYSKVLFATGAITLVIGVFLVLYTSSEANTYFEDSRALILGIATGAPIIILGIVIMAFGKVIPCFVSMENYSQLTYRVLTKTQQQISGALTSRNKVDDEPA